MCLVADKKLSYCKQIACQWYQQYPGGLWRWALVSPDGVAPSWMVTVCASVILSLHHKVQKFSWHWLTRVVPENGRKMVVVVVSAIWIRCCEKSHSKRVAIDKNNLNKITLKVTQDHRK